MPVFWLNQRMSFPDPRQASEDGLLAVGGDLSVARLLQAYGCGVFPWYGEGDPILWWSPPKRALFFPGEEHFSRRTRRALRHAPFEVRIDTCFEDVLQGCAETPRGDGGGTWLLAPMREAYLELHRHGYAHSFETFRDGRLVGGLYGLALGAAFFGESMFSREDYASRAAFACLCEEVWRRGFHFIDGQLPNGNLMGLGARILDRTDFLDRLRAALEKPTLRGAWHLQGREVHGRGGEFEEKGGT